MKHKQSSIQFKKAMLNVGLDRKKLVSLSGLSIYTIRDWELGVHKPKDWVYKFLELYDKLQEVKKFVGRYERRIE